jgi:hypothetical protein
MAINLSLGNANRIYYWLVTLNALIFCTSIIRNRLELIIRIKVSIFWQSWVRSPELSEKEIYLRPSGESK